MRPHLCSGTIYSSAKARGWRLNMRWTYHPTGNQPSGSPKVLDPRVESSQVPQSLQPASRGHGYEKKEVSWLNYRIFVRFCAGRTGMRWKSCFIHEKSRENAPVLYSSHQPALPPELLSNPQLIIPSQILKPNLCYPTMPRFHRVPVSIAILHSLTMTKGFKADTEAPNCACRGHCQATRARHTFLQTGLRICSIAAVQRHSACCDPMGAPGGQPSVAHSHEASAARHDTPHTECMQHLATV